MKRLMIIAAASAIAFASTAATNEELNKIAIKDVTAENASEVFDAAVATTNLNRILWLVQKNKVSLEDAVHKTMGKSPLRMCKAAFDGSSTTNYALVAEAVRAIDFTVPMNDLDSQAARDILYCKGFVVNNSEVSKPIIADIYAKNKLFGAEIYLSVYTKHFKELFIDDAPAVYEAVKPLIKNNANKRQAAIIWHYAINFAKDYDNFASIYDKRLISTLYWWLYPISIKNPVVVQLMKDELDVFKTSLQQKKDNNNIFLRVSKCIDSYNGDKTATLGVIDYLTTSKAKLEAALYCNNIDKILEILIACDTTFEPSNIEAVIGPINALDPDYKPTEVMKALKALNQRYTLKLYDDRDAWEPVLSKIRALIDTRM